MLHFLLTLSLPEPAAWAGLQGLRQRGKAPFVLPLPAGAGLRTGTDKALRRLFR